MVGEGSFELNSILSQIGKDKGIDKQVLIEAIESAVLSAARKHYGHNLNLETRFNEDTNEVDVVQFKTVVEKVEDPATQISLSEAQREYYSEAKVGEEFGMKLDTTVLGRIAAQTAKQVILQKLRDAERGVIFEEFKDSKGNLINGIVQRYDRGNLIVNLGRTEAIMPKREQIMREKYRQGDRIRAMILDIDPTARGPQIVLTRSHPDFLMKLFALEVPEIAEGIIEIKHVAREPGERAKIAVHSNDQNVDPVGACVGIKGSRVQAVVQELRGERIDIITWSPDAPSFVARALSPAQVARVIVDEEDHSMEVIVPDEQLALAIGRKGQNVKLASRLSGWRIDVRSVSVAEEESKRARKALEGIPEIEFTHAELLFQEGFRSAREVADAAVDDIAALSGFNPELAAKIVENAKRHVDELIAQGISEGIDVATISDLDKLALPTDLRDRVIAAGYVTVQALMSADSDDLLKIPGFTDIEVNQIRDATDALLKAGPRPSELSRGGGAAGRAA